MKMNELYQGVPIYPRQENWADPTRFQNDYLLELLERSPTKVVASSTIEWSDRDGSTYSTYSGYHFSVREARKYALRSAIKMGWAKPRWWQYWRWGETVPSLDFTAIDPSLTELHSISVAQ